MTTNFPTSTDTFTHPNPNDPRSGSTSASGFVSTLQDAVSALETKVGVNSSADNTSQDYKLSGVTTGDKAMSKTGTETATNKTFTAPKINVGGDATGDIYYRDSGGAFQRLPIGSAGQILDVSASLIPEWIPNPAASDATYAVKGVRVLDANAAYYAADAGSTDTYAITLSPALLAYAVGQVFTFKANTINTGAATLNINGLGAKTIVKGVNTALVTGDIAAGQVCIVEYDGTNFVLQSPVSTSVSIQTVYHPVGFTQVLTNGNSSSYTDIDLSAIVGAKASLVVFKADMNGAGAAGFMNIKAKGDSTTYASNGTVVYGTNAIEAGNVTINAILMCPTDSNGVIQYQVTGAGSPVGNLYVMGYIN